MKQKSESLTAADFFEKLQQDKLTKPIPNNLRGMVKKSESKAKTIEFAFETNCNNWISIPLELIKNVVVLQTVPCKNHFHAFVEITLVEPKTTEGKLLLSLLSSIYKNCRPAVIYTKGVRCERGQSCYCSDYGGSDCNPNGNRPEGPYTIPVTMP